MNKIGFFEQLNEAQSAAVYNDINSCTKVVAGAGCGKTKVISSRFLKLSLDLIEAGTELPLEKILVITFTDKAANEMKERIFSTLKDAGIDYYSQSLWVSTFHGFCSKILRKHSIEAALAPNFKLGEEKNLKEIYDRIVEKIKNSAVDEIAEIDELANNLGLKKEILNVENFKLLGKISDLNEIFETIYEVIKKIKSLGISPIEFLNKTSNATEKFSRIVENLPFGFDCQENFINGWISHLRNYTDDFCNFENAFKRIADKKLILTKNGSSKAQNWAFAPDYPENIKKIEEVELFLVQTIALIYSIYESELLKSAVVDFDDLINKTILIFKNNPEIRACYQNQFCHIIIDEFQDTNGAQLELIKLLLSKDHANITFVGDRKQSIYGFRHAQSENLEVLHNHIEEKYGQKYPEIMLNTNYRSTSEVLDVVNYLTREFLNLNEELSSGFCSKHNEEKQVFKTVFEDVENALELKTKQANYIADEILKLKARNNPKYGDIAILVNSHKEAEFIEKFLLRAKIPCLKKVNTGFFESATVKNLTALLRLAKNKYDEIALIRVLKIKLSDRQIYEIARELDKNEVFGLRTSDPQGRSPYEIARELDKNEVFGLRTSDPQGRSPYEIAEVCEKNLSVKIPPEEFKKLNFAQKLYKCYEDGVFLESKEVAPYIEKIINVINSIKRGEKIISIFYKLITEIKPFYPKKRKDDYKKSSKKSENSLFDSLAGETKESNSYEVYRSQIDLRTFEKIIENYENSHQSTYLPDFLSYLESIAQDVNFELPNLVQKGTDAVNILTIHASKGLEFDYVFCTAITSKTVHGGSERIIFDLGYGSKAGFGIIAEKFIGKDTPKALLYKQIWKNPRNENEKLRLFYVAISRAKKYLNILTFAPYKGAKPVYYVEQMKK